MAHRGDPVTRRVPRPSLRAICTWAAVAAAIVLACTTDTAIGPDATLDSLYVEPATATIVVDDTLRLTAIGINHAGRRFADTRAQWTTSDAAISVSSVGVAIGRNTGVATARATVGSKSATATVTVQPKPAFVTSRDSVPFTTIANGPVPTTQTVVFTNGGGGSLAPTVDSISYGPGATGWLSAALSGFVAPDTLALDVLNTALPVGTYTATVALTAPKATNSPKSIKVTLIVGVGTPTTMTVDSGDAQTATVNTAVPVKPTVLVRDQYGNPVPGVGVTFAVTFGGGSVNPTGAVATDGSGRARATTWTLGTGAGPDTLRASATGLTAVKFAATGTAGAPAATSKAAGDGQSATVATAVATQPTLLVTDQFGNPVESVSVTFSVVLGGGGVTGATHKTDGAGHAAVGSWTLGTQAGTNTLNATAASLPAATFSANGTAGVADSITRAGGNAQTDTVGATLATAYTVRVADQYGNAVSNVTVTWAASGGGSITASSLTNGSGIASATRVLGTVAGPQGATATVGGLIGSPVAFSATATHGNATTILKFTGDAQSATAGSPVAIAPAAKVIDQFTNPVPGVGVTFATRPGSGTVVPTTPIATDTAGKAAVTSWTLGPTAGTNNDSLIASASGLTAVTFTASGLSGAAKNLLLSSGDAQSDTIGASLALYTVRVTDSLGNGVQGVPVSWLVTAGGGSITPSSNTDASGFATATRVLGNSVGVDSATASVGGLLGSPVHFGATALHGNPAQIFKIAGDGQSATVNTSVGTAPRVQVTDRAGNPIQSASVTFAVALGGGSTLPASPATLGTDAGGFAQLTSWTVGTTAGSNTISATSSGTPGATFGATGTPDAPSASQSSVVDNAASITACSVSCTVVGGTADSVTVTVRDQFNNLIGGASVTVASTGTSNGFTPSASGSTNGSGVFAAKLNSTVAEGKTISATATTGLGGGGITQTAAVTVNPAGVSSAQSSLSAGTGTITACSTSCVAGSTASTITITVRDAFNNVISGATVIPSATGTGNTFTPASGGSNGSGVFTSAFNSTVAQGKTVSATANAGAGAVAITQTAAVTVNAAAPSTVTVTSAGFSARVGTGVATRPTYTVRDAFSNLVTNFAVSYSSSFSGAFSGPATTNGSGQVTLTSWTMAGTNTDDGFGRMPNSVTVTAGSASGSATDYGIYTWTDSRAQIGTGTVCSGCHVSWSMGAPLDGAGTQNLVGFAGTGGCAGFTRVVASSAGSSMLYNKLTGAPCGSQMPLGGPFFSAAQLKIIRAWINNGAQNN